MVSLNDRIADVKRKAEAYRSIPVMSQDYWRVWEQWRETSRYLLPSLIVEWVEERDRDKARIEELEKALKEVSEAVWEEGFTCGAYAEANAKKGKLNPDIQNPYSTASRALNGEKL